MTDWMTGTITSHGTKLHYYRTGGAKPPLVLIHGITDDGLCWAPTAAVLAGQYDVIMVDLRGHGKSEAPDQLCGDVGYDIAEEILRDQHLVILRILQQPHCHGVDICLPEFNMGIFFRRFSGYREE